MTATHERASYHARSRKHAVLIPPPRPRQGSWLVSILIPVYSVSLLAFLVPLMHPERRSEAYGISFITSLVCLPLHIAIMRGRDRIYKFTTYTAAKLGGLPHATPVRFFEFPFSFLVLVVYACAFLIVPILAGLVPFAHSTGQVLTSRDVPMYFVVSVGAVLTAAILSGLDIYPVNHFGTIESLKILISITLQLMTVANRVIALVIVSILFAWAIGKIELGPDLLFFTLYVLIGLGTGVTGVLGSRVTDLLYELSELEISHPRRKPPRASELDSEGADDSEVEDSLEPAVGLLEPGSAY